MADIGEPIRRIEVEPIPAPAEAPVQEPTPEPQREKEPAVTAGR
jgi:hypothetical protein